MKQILVGFAFWYPIMKCIWLTERLKVRQCSAQTLCATVIVQKI